ncbi:hypothetical protein PPL_04185, partial [Heterostelium album PN500]
VGHCATSHINENLSYLGVLSRSTLCKYKMSNKFIDLFNEYEESVLGEVDNLVISKQLNIRSNINQITFGKEDQISLNVEIPKENYIINLPPANADIVLTETDQKINGIKSFSEVKISNLTIEELNCPKAVIEQISSININTLSIDSDSVICNKINSVAGSFSDNLTVETINANQISSNNVNSNYITASNGSISNVYSSQIYNSQIVFTPSINTNTISPFSENVVNIGGQTIVNDIQINGKCNQINFINSPTPLNYFEIFTFNGIWKFGTASIQSPFKIQRIGSLVSLTVTSPKFTNTTQNSAIICQQFLPPRFSPTQDQIVTMGTGESGTIFPVRIVLIGGGFTIQSQNGSIISVTNGTVFINSFTLKVVDSNSIFSLINLIWNWILRQSILSSRFPDFLEILEYDIDLRINNIV